jgi:23S rRNA (uracil1939-C5)-methyltransferase
VTTVETFAPAAQATEAAARAQGIDRLDARIGSAELWLPRLAAAGERYDAVVANPPRRGMTPRVRQALAELGAERVVYISCEPATLARDLAHLARLGLRTVRLAPFDLMPQTAEVECVAVLHRAAPARPSVLFEDEWLLAIDEPVFGSREFEEAPALRPEREASGVSLYARDSGTAARLRRARIAVRYLVLVRGVARARGRVGERGGPGRHRRLAVLAGHALLEVRAEAGRPRSIRRQLAAIGEPVLGDERHGHAPSNRHLFERFGLDRPFLHLASIELVHPRSGRRLRVAAPLAPDLALVVERLGGDPREFSGSPA